ncbi:hypothetical protein MMC27_008170 [Xylographa pallens]|nr:hypothetical protein [Xylographa pallens]
MDSYSPRIVRSPPSYRLSHSQHTVSPSSDYLAQSTTSTATTSRFKDPQILLLQRWQRVTGELATRRLSRKSVVVLNRALDEAEDLLAWDESQVSQDMPQQNTGLGIADDVFVQKMDIGQTMTPPDSTILNAPEGLEMERKDIERIKHTEPVLERVESLVKELRKRQEDFRYLHSIVIAKAEEGAETIMQLETDRENLETDIADDQCELTYLKLKLRILEIQGLPYIPVNERDDLAEGIHRWKLDWADVDSRFRARRKKREPGKNRSTNMNAWDPPLKRIGVSPRDFST